MTPFLGLRVLDFSHVIAGPMATFYLAQMGAEVTKVERPGVGDVMRGNKQRGASQFVAFNAGKKSVQIDLKTPEGLAQALAMAKLSDVFVDNFRPGVLARLGLGPEVLRKENPQLIYCVISGWGSASGAWKGRSAYDHVIQAASGLTMLAGHEGDAPVKMGAPVVDVMTGVLAAFAITAAIQERQRTGQGSVIDVSMWGAALQLMYPFSVEALQSGASPARVGNQAYSGSPAAEIFDTAEGRLAVGANTQEQITSLFRVLGWSEAQAAEDLERGPGFARARDPQAFRAKLGAALASRSAAEWEQAMNLAGVPAAKVRTVGEFVTEAKTQGAIDTLHLRHEGSEALSPGLGWRILPG